MYMYIIPKVDILAQDKREFIVYRIVKETGSIVSQFSCEGNEYTHFLLVWIK